MPTATKKRPSIVGFRASDSVKIELRETAFRLGISKSAVIKKALIEFFAGQTKTPVA